MTEFQKIRPRPALAPILFPLESVDVFGWDRLFTRAIAKLVSHRPDLAAKQSAWAARMDARIAQVAK